MPVCERSTKNTAYTLELLRDTNVLAVSMKYGDHRSGHYDIYQHINNIGEKQFIAKNGRNYSSVWTYLHIFFTKIEFANVVNILDKN